MEKGRKDTVLLTVIGIATLLVAIVGATFAFFTARITNNDTNSTLTIRSSSGGSTMFYSSTLTAQNIYPRGTGNSEPWVVKPFRVEYSSTSTSSYDFTYKLKLNYTNGFGTDQIRWDLNQVSNYCIDNTSVTETDCGTTNWKTANNTGTRVSEQTNQYFATTSTYVDLGNGVFPAGTTSAVHAYTLTISYPNDASNNQNNAGFENGSDTNQGKTLTAWVSIEEVQ